MKQKDQKQAEVKTRTEEHNKLSTIDKINKAKSRRGNSKRELERLVLQLKAENEIKPKKK